MADNNYNLDDYPESTHKHLSEIKKLSFDEKKSANEIAELLSIDELDVEDAIFMIEVDGDNLDLDNDVNLDDENEVKDFSNFTKEEFEKASRESNESNELLEIAAAFLKSLNDKKLAKTILEKAIKYASCPEEFFDIAKTVHNYYDDINWTKKILHLSEKKLSDFENDDNSTFQEYFSLGQGIYELLGDQEWTKKLYLSCMTLNIGFSGDVIKLGDKICLQLNDKSLAKKVYTMALEDDLARDLDDLLTLAESIKNNLEDEEFCNEICNKIINMLEDPNNDYDYEAFAETTDRMFSDLDKKSYARKIYQLGLQNANLKNKATEYNDELLDILKELK